MKILRFIIFFIVLFIFFRFVFIFRNINCSVANATLESGVCQRINDYFRGRSLFFTDFANEPIWDELLTDQQYGQVYQYQKINKSLNGKADLYLLAKLPDYRLIFGQNRYLLNQSNQLKNDQDRLNLPTIEFMGDASLVAHGYLDETYHQKFFALSQALTKYKIETNKIVWQNDQEIHLFTKEIEVILDDQKDFNYQIQRLSLILKHNEVENILANKKILDLRFNLPVLKDF